MIEDDEIGVSNEETVAHARAKMPDEQTMSDLGDFFKNFGDSTRIKIVSALISGELCVADLAEVKSRRNGKQVYYTIDDNHVGILYSVGLEHIREGR